MPAWAFQALWVDPGRDLLISYFYLQPRWAFRDAYVQIFFILKTFIPFSAEMVLLHLSLTSRVSITTTPTRAKRKGQKKQRLKGILYTLQIESKIDHMETQISDTKRPERLPKQNNQLKDTLPFQQLDKSNILNQQSTEGYGTIPVAG